MIILTIISLFTVRVNLDSLGAADYGLYNVVAGFVSMFSFISGTLTVASQRFFAIALGKNNWEDVNKYFSVNFVIYIIFSIVIVLLAETFGLWFVLHKMNIAPERMNAAIIVYQFSIVSFVIGIIISPHLALMIADENLSIYAFVSIFEGIFKVLVAYSIYKTKNDKLIVYSFLLLCITVIVNGFYLFYTRMKYKKLKLKIIKDITVYREVFGFLNWNMIGAIASVGKGQGLNIVINLFFGTVVNAARGIAFQINNVISSFSINFMKAIDPLITKNYASGNKEKFFEITCTASKISFFLLFIITMPLIKNLDYVLKLWLKNVPEYTVVFASLALIDALVMSLTDPISTAIQAIGKLKWYQIVVGGLFLLNVPLAYMFLKISENPYIPFIVSICVSLGMSVGKMIFFKYLGQVSIGKYITNVIFRVIVVCFIAFIFDYFLINPANAFFELLLNVIIEVLFIATLIIIFGLSKKERKIFLLKIPFVKRLDKDK